MPTHAIYARQSIDKEGSISIEGQIELCRAEAGPEAVIYQDKGYSGKNMSRPDFRRLMDDVRQGKVSKVVCYRLDRISRSITDFGTIWEALSEHGVEFSSVTEKFDTSTPVGRAMLHIIMVFAQLERETIAARIKDNYYQRVRRGAWPGGPAPFGYTIQKQKGEICKLVPNEDLALVPRLFELYTQPGASLGSVTRWLRENLPAGNSRPQWSTVSLGRLLRHPAYVRADATVYGYYHGKGVIMANDIEAFDGHHGAVLVGKRDANTRKYTELKDHLLALADHEGLIPADLFLACQQKLDSNKQVKNSGKSQYTWLSGLLKCSVCGYSLVVAHDREYNVNRLYCSGKTGLGICTRSGFLKLPDIEVQVLTEMQNFLEQSLNRVRTEADAAAISALKASLATIEVRINNLIGSLSEAASVTMRYINAEVIKLEEQKNDILLKLSKVNPLPKHLSAFSHLELEDLSFDEKRAVARLLIDRIHCDQSTVQIAWKT